MVKSPGLFLGLFSPGTLKLGAIIRLGSAIWVPTYAATGNYDNASGIAQRTLVRGGRARDADVDDRPYRKRDLGCACFPKPRRSTSAVVMGGCIVWRRHLDPVAVGKEAEANLKIDASLAAVRHASPSHNLRGSVGRTVGNSRILAPRRSAATLRTDPYRSLSWNVGER